MSETCKDTNNTWKIYKDTAGEWRWTRTASNGKITGASSEGYINKSDCIANARLPGMSCTPS